MLNKEDVIWYTEEEYVALSYKRWDILLYANHYRTSFWYEIRSPKGYYEGKMYSTIFEAIDALNAKLL